MAGIANARNCYIMLFPQLFNVFLQILCREAAHGNTAYSLQIAARQLKAEIICNCPRILAIQLEEVPNLIQHNFIGVRRLYVVIVVINRVPHGVLRHFLVIGCLLIRRKVAVQPNQLRDARSDLVPIHLNVCTAVLFQHNAFAAVIFIAAAFSGYSMGASSDAILFFQKIGILLWGVRSLEKLIDAGLSTLKAASVCKRSSNFIFGDKPAGCWNSLHIGAEFLSWKGQIFQTCEKCLRLVVMEAQQRTVFAVGVHEYLVFRQEPIPERRIQQIVRQTLRFLWKAGAMDIAYAGQIPLRFCLIRKIVMKFPNFGGNTQTLVPGRFRDLQIGGKCAAVQKFLNTLRRICPAYHLCRAKITRGISGCNMDTIVPVPCGKPAVIRNQAVAAVVKSFQKCRAIL